jgi:putative chitinase
MFTTDDLTRLAKACGAKPSAVVVQGIVDNQHWLAEGGIDTTARVTEFLAQACLETDYFKTLREYWGPTKAQAGYEGRRDLGNVVAGDGKKFMGRGIFQCTGRDNYARYGKRLGLDLLKEPELAARPDISVRIAVMYWNDKGLNVYADRGQTAAISRAINRGSATAKSPANHEADRIKIAKLARDSIKIGGDQSAAGIPVTEQNQQVEAVTRPPPANTSDAVPVEALPTKPAEPPMLPASPEPRGFWAALIEMIASIFKRKPA